MIFSHTFGHLLQDYNMENILDKLTLILLCGIVLVLVVTFVVTFFRLVNREKRIGKQIEKEYRESERFKETRRKFIEKIEKKNKK